MTCKRVQEQIQSMMDMRTNLVGSSKSLQSVRVHI